MTAKRIDKALASKLLKQFQNDLTALRAQRVTSTRKFLVDVYIEFARIQIKGVKKGLLILD